MRGSVGSRSDGDNQMHRKSQGRGRDGRKQPSFPVSSPPAASFPAPHEVGLPGVVYMFLPQASTVLGSGLIFRIPAGSCLGALPCSGPA